MVRRTDMTTIGMLSRAMNMPSFDANGPLNPSLNSATRQPDLINRHAADTAAPV